MQILNGALDSLYLPLRSILLIELHVIVLHKPFCVPRDISEQQIAGCALVKQETKV